MSLNLLPRSIRENVRHDEAVAYMKEVEPKVGINYDWVVDYAKAHWGEERADFRALDDKADSIIKYLGGGTGLFALAMLSRIDAGNAYLAWATLPALLAAIIALVYASMARIPSGTGVMPTVREAKEVYADGSEFPEVAQAAFLGKYHLACERTAMACARKANFIEVASWFYLAAIGLLAVPILVACFYPPLTK